jgi:signal transduction histidine kinase
VTTPHRSPPPYLPGLEFLDRVLTVAFSTNLPREVSSDPGLRFLAYLRVLEPFGISPGFNEQDNLLFRRCVADDDFMSFRKILLAVVKPTYAVTSYWSPIDAKRHSVYHRPTAGNSERSARVSALTFFAMTLAGDPSNADSRSTYRPDALYSTTQFIARYAVNKVSRPICHEDLLPATPSETWWHISSHTQNELLMATGLADLLESLAKDASLTDESIDAALRSALVNTSGDLGPSALGTRALDTFRQRVLGLPQHLLAIGESAASMLSSDFGTPLTTIQALFMIVTHAIWRTACPGTGFAYTFPTLVADTCCVFTVGTKRPLRQQTVNFLAYLAKTLFLHPLIEDYSEKARIEETKVAVERAARVFQTERGAFRHLLGHNLPKLLIRPATQKLRLLDRRLRRYSPAVESATLQLVEDMAAVFAHYDAFLQSLASASSLESLFKRRSTEQIVLPKFVEPLIQKMDRLFRAFVVERFPNAKKRVHLDLKWEIDEVEVPIYIDRALLEEVLLVLLTNSVEAIPPSCLPNQPERAIITIGIGLNDERSFVQVRVKDKGNGIDPSSLLKLRGRLLKLWDLDHDAVWGEVDNQIDEALRTPEREDSLKIGLLFCVTFLRSLEWFHPTLRPGVFDIESEHGVGTEVTIGLPV